MNKFLAHRINQYAKYMGNNLPYLNPDGTILDTINFDFDILSDEYIEYVELYGDKEDDTTSKEIIPTYTIAKSNEKPDNNMAKIFEKIKLHDTDFNEFLTKFTNNYVFQGNLIINKQAITNEVLSFINRSCLIN